MKKKKLNKIFVKIIHFFFLKIFIFFQTVLLHLNNHTPLCIKTFFLRLEKYEFDLKCSSGKTMLVSDAFSRTYCKFWSEFDKTSLIHHVHFLALSWQRSLSCRNHGFYMIRTSVTKEIILNFSISNEHLEQFKEITQKDPIAQTLLKTLFRVSHKNLLFCMNYNRVFSPS